MLLYPEERQRKKIYEKSIFSYGILPMLYLLGKNENRENYRECQVILDVLEAYYKEFDINLPTRFNSDTIKAVKGEFERLGTTGDIAISNIDTYARKIEADLKKK